MKIFFQVKVSSYNQEPGKSRDQTKIWTSKQFSTFEEAQIEAKFWERQRKAHAEIDNTGLDPEYADWTVIDEIWIEQVTVIEKF